MSNVQIELGPYLGDLGTRNPHSDALKDWLFEVGQRLQDEGKRLVVVVDGLDHVWRERESSEELRKLFDQLLPSPPGVVLVVGTQPVENRYLPQSLLELAPREAWIELPRLDRQATSEWLVHHRDLMPAYRGQDSNNWQLSQITTSLYIRTRGHPLLNRYLVDRIASGSKPLTVDSIEAIPEGPADSVEDYYRSLWVSLSEEARDIVFLLAVAKFPWPEDGLFECLRLVGYDRASSLAGVSAVRHLLGHDAMGLSPFHNSILLYASQRLEFPTRAPALRDATIGWLDKLAPKYWRRSYLWILQLESGDAKPLLSGTNRHWAIEAIAAGHPLVDVERLLQTGGLGSSGSGRIL